MAATPFFEEFFCFAAVPEAGHEAEPPAPDQRSFREVDAWHHTQTPPPLHLFVPGRPADLIATPWENGIYLWDLPSVGNL